MRSPDFGRAARDYAAHRKGFPDSFFARFDFRGLRLLDLGSGTGTLARGFGGIALDRSIDMLRQAPDLPRVASCAERLPFRDASFDAVTAGQCWHWFDGPRAAAEARRILRPGGRILIAHWSYLPRPDNAAGLAEEWILRRHPTWAYAGMDGIYERWRDHLAGFREVSSFWYDETVVYSQEDWRGRVRACGGCITMPDPAGFDGEFAARLRERFGDAPLEIPHRLFAISGVRG